MDHMYKGEDKLKILGVLKSCMSSEIDGYNFYLWASTKTRNLEGKSLLMDLAEEEMKHTKILEDEFTKHGGIKTWREDSHEKGIKDWTFAVSPWFRWRVDEKTTYKEALRIAVDLERDAVEFYSNLARNTKDQELHRVFSYLADIENRHLEMIRNQYESYCRLDD